jgi:hypothetical protein
MMTQVTQSLAIVRTPIKQSVQVQPVRHTNQLAVSNDTDTRRYKSGASTSFILNAY